MSPIPARPSCSVLASRHFVPQFFSVRPIYSRDRITESWGYKKISLNAPNPTAPLGESRGVARQSPGLFERLIGDGIGGTQRDGSPQLRNRLAGFVLFEIQQA
jgi:hypothetical protein